MKFIVVIKDNRYKTKNEIIESYRMKFSDVELNNEEWKCFDQIPKYFKQYMDSDDDCTLNKEKILYDQHNYYISTLGRIGILQPDGTLLLKSVCQNAKKRLFTF